MVRKHKRFNFPTRLESAWKALIIFIIIICLGSCKPKFRGAISPPTSACTFNLTNIFTTCFYPKNSSNIISYTVDFKVWFKRGNDKFELNKQTVQSSSPATSSLTINSVLPTDRTSYYIEITITGTQCSTCALTQYGQQTCIQVDDGTFTTAAKPRLGFTSTTRNDYVTSVAIFDWIPLSNDGGSCGCQVPNN